jgi:outer membrane protein assembly factor BamB/plastocyanin
MRNRSVFKISISVILVLSVLCVAAGATAAQTGGAAYENQAAENEAAQELTSLSAGSGLAVPNTSTEVDDYQRINREQGGQVTDNTSAETRSETAQRASGTTVYVGSRDSKLYAVDAATGSQQWAFDTGDYVRSSPTVVDGTVYVGSRDSKLYAVDAGTGTEQWAFDTGASVVSSPTVVDGTVYVGSQDDNLYAVDAATGEQEWAFDTDGFVRSSPTVVDGTVYVGSEDLTLYAVDAGTGSEEWVFETGRGVQSSPTVVDGTVYVRSSERLYAVDEATGEQVWKFTKLSDIGLGTREPSPTIVNGTVYVGSGDSNGDGALYAVDAGTGEQEWAFDTGSAVWSSPTVVDDTVYVMSGGFGGFSDGNTLYAVDAGTGSEEWAFETGRGGQSSPTVVKNPESGNSIGSRVRLRTLGHIGSTPNSGQNLAPIISVSQQTASPAVGEEFELSASESTDPNGDSLSYEWDVGADGTIDATGPTITESFDTTGTKQVQVTVSDGDLQTTTTREIEIRDPSAVPNAVISAQGTEVNVTPDKINISAGTRVRFDGSGSAAPAGRTVETYTWSFGTGATATGPQVSHNFDSSGTYEVRLRVTDSAGVTDSATRTVEVGSPEGPVITSITQPADGIIPQGPTQISGFDRTWRVTPRSSASIQQATFSFPGGQTITDTDGSDGWTATPESSQENELTDGTLSVSVTDADGQTAQQEVRIETFDLPLWGVPYSVPESQSKLKGGLQIGLPKLQFNAGIVGAELDVVGKTRVRHALGTRQAQLGGSGQIGFEILPVTTYPGVGVEAGLNVTGDARVLSDRLETQRVIVTGTLTREVILPIFAPQTPVGEVELTSSIGTDIALETRWNTTDTLALTGGSATYGITLVPLSLDAAVSAGPVVLASASIGGEVSIAGTVGINKTGDFDGTLSGSGKLFARGSVGFLRFEESIGPEGEIEVFSTNPQANASDSVEWSLMDKRSTRPAVPSSPVFQSTATSASPLSTRLSNDTLGDRTPDIVSDENGTTAVWAAQDPNQTVANGTELVVRTKSNGTLTSTTALTDDARYDTSPAVATTGNARGLAWSRAFEPFGNETPNRPADLLKKLEVHAAPLPTTDVENISTIESERLSNNSVPDIEPTIAGTGTSESDGWLVGWIQDTDANISTVADRRVEYAVLGPNRTSVQARGSLNASAVATARDGDELVLVARNTTNGTTVRRLQFDPNGTVVAQTTYDAPNATDVTATGGTTAWTVDTPNDQQIQVASSGTQETIEDLPVGVTNPQLQATGNGQMVLAYQARPADSNTSTVFYHLNNRTTTDWSGARQIQTRDVPVQRAAVSATTDGVITAFESTPNSTVRADIVAVNQPYSGANLTVTAQAQNVSALDARVQAVVTNRGGRPANATTLRLKTPSGQNRTATVPALEPGEQVTRNLSVTQPLAGSARVAVDDESSIAGNPPADDRATANLTADLAVSNVRDRLTSNRSTVIVSFDVNNTGPLPARNVSYRAQIGNQTVTKTISGLGLNRSQTRSARFDASNVSNNDQVNITLDPAGEIPDPVSENNRVRQRVRQPDVGVLSDITVGDGGSGYGQATRFSAINSDTGAPTAQVRVSAANRSNLTLQGASASNTSSVVYNITLPPARGENDTVYTPVQLAVPSATPNESVGIASSPRNGSDTDLSNDITTDGIDNTTSLGSYLQITSTDVLTTSSGPVASISVRNPSNRTIGEIVRLTNSSGVVRQTPVVVRPGERVQTRIAFPVNESTQTTAQTVNETVVVDGPPILADKPPGDIDGDNLYEDVRGDGEANILDTQALFNALVDGSAQETPQAFGFSQAGPDDEVTILDVAAHWRTYVAGD